VKKAFRRITATERNAGPAARQLDAALLYGLAFKKAPAGLKRFHAAAEEWIAPRDIAEVIGKRLNIPLASKSPAEASNPPSAARS